MAAPIAKPTLPFLPLKAFFALPQKLVLDGPPLPPLCGVGPPGGVGPPDDVPLPFPPKKLPIVSITFIPLFLPNLVKELPKNDENIAFADLNNIVAPINHSPKFFNVVVNHPNPCLKIFINKSTLSAIATSLDSLAPVIISFKLLVSPASFSTYAFNIECIP